MSERGRSGPPPISVGDAARRLGVSTRTVQRWLREGRLPAVRVGDRLKVDPAAFALETRPDAELTKATAPANRPTSGPTRSVRRLLVANRGELPVRIAKTCRRLGIVSIALVTSDQQHAWWATQLDERQPLDGTYLDGTAILEAARAASADAIHPGYGFLAENAAFADAVVGAGLIWVGPPAAAMRALGDKAAGRRLAASVGVPTLPGYDGADQSDETLRREAARVGYPVLIKPSAGGGGKGMHAATDDREMADLLLQARREARTAFGDDRLILERYVPRPRHVEVQLLLDAHGNGVHLGERDCSLQRRHQKVIEEAPSPAVDAGLRSRLGDAALGLARGAGYVGAGTAEFLLDSQANFFFLEVNARLQVEHPVTEAVTGRDLVEDQLRIAAGEPLGFTQADIRWQGHAIEARLYAEDPWAGFLPSTGQVVETRWPTGARVDRGIETGDTVGTRYDPLLAKVIVHANDRPTAIAGLNDALDETSVFGVTTNRGFLKSLLALPSFASGRPTTDLIERAWTPSGEPAIDDAWPVAAWGLSHAAPSAAARPGFRLNSAPRIRVRIEAVEIGVPVPSQAPGVPWAVETGAETPTVFIDLDGLSVRAQLAPAPTVETAVSHAQRSDAASTVTAPMPGVVLHVRVEEGETVETGQVLVVLEAMKMENAVTAPSEGTVVRVNVRDGEQVARGDILVELRSTMPYPTRVRIYEVGPRDGLQNEATAVPTGTKLEYIKRLAAAGLTEIEATSFVSAKAVPQLADADVLLAQLPDTDRVRYPVLVPNERGMDRAEAAGARAIAVFTGANESFTKANIGMTIQESLDAFRPVLARAAQKGMWTRAYVSTAFGSPFDGAVEPAAVVDVSLRLVDLGAEEICLGDTIGVGVPSQVHELTRGLLEAGIPLDRLAYHFHDTRGTALANVVAALEDGITCFDASSGGTGGCPYAPGAAGNLATEDLVYLLDGMGIETGVSLEGVLGAAQFIVDALGRPLASKVGQAGGWEPLTGKPLFRMSR